MRFYPAIDILDGKCVRLEQGRYDSATHYDADPTDALRRWADGGATHVHVVNLNGARSGADDFGRVIERLAAAAPGVHLQTGGGVRSEIDLLVMIEAGAWRVVVGTAAVRHPEMVQQSAERWPGQIVVGVDVKGGEVAVSGWESGSGKSVQVVLDLYAAFPIAAYLYTEISRDGMLVGPDMEGLRRVAHASGHSVIASGGVRNAADIRALAHADFAADLDGVIVGKALYEGRLTIAEGLEAAGT